MAKLSSEGIITFPSNLRTLLGVDAGDWLFFEINQSRQIAYVRKDRGHSDSCVRVQRDGEFSLPNDIRKWFRIQTGDELEFGYDGEEDAVYLKKRRRLLTCPICGDARFIRDMPCFVCREEGFIEEEPWLNAVARLISTNRKYGVSVALLDLDLSNFQDLPVKRIELRSSKYALDVIESAQDHYQLNIIKGEIEDGNLDPAKHENELLSMLLQDSTKDSLRHWLATRL